MPNPSLPTREFREHTDLQQLKRQAKELLASVRSGDPAALREANTHYSRADPSTFALHDAQLVLARAYGFRSWPKLKAYVDGVNAKQLGEAVRTGALDTVSAMLRARPELVNMDRGEDEHRAIHDAVVHRSPEMTRLLMRHGADARKGVWPHRDATSAFTLATDRGFDEIVAIILVEEQNRRDQQAGSSAAAAPDTLLRAEAWESGRALEMLRAAPALAQSVTPDGWTPLHAAAGTLDEEGTAWLLEHGADPDARAKGRWTPIDLAASGRAWDEDGTPERFERIAHLLLSGGARLTDFAAVALGDAESIRARHRKGALDQPISTDDLLGCGGLVAVAVLHDRPEMLSLLLDLGFDPDERTRVGGMDEIIYSAGEPLYCCVRRNKPEMARLLLARGADPNGNVYASGSPLFRAYSQKDWDLVRLLEQHGGFLDAVSAGYACQTGAARQLLADEAAGCLRPGALNPGKTVAEELLWSASGGGDPEIVRMALERIDWPREDIRWHWPLWQAFTCDGGLEPGLACFRLLLSRADPNLASDGRTILHTIMARGGPEHLPFAEMLLDHGARFDLRDNLLQSTALGWACRWGRLHFVRLLLERGADAIEAGAPPWASPKAWARKRGHTDVLALLVPCYP